MSQNFRPSVVDQLRERFIADGFRDVSDVKTPTIEACGNYSRPLGVMGGSCSRCGRSQPEHAYKQPAPP